MQISSELEQILMRVQKPARYVGGEWNAVMKDPAQVDVRLAFCFPDTYEIGMSNLGMKILYGLFNEMDGVWCERVFMPWGDMRQEMQQAKLPLYGLESGEPIRDFDIVAFSLGYEMAYTNVLAMLDLAGIPRRSADRPGLAPLVVAGGVCTYNAEPLADFIDLCFLGEGEDMDRELIAAYRSAKARGLSKAEFLREAAKIPGIYVPSLYDIHYKADGTIAEIVPKDGAPATIRKRIIEDFDHAYFPDKVIVPSTEIVHDRVVLELFRGCIRGCRFCQAGYVYRPVRTRGVDRLVQQGICALEDSGYQEITLSSLSTSDYRELNGLCDKLLDWCEPHQVSLSLPSLRADNFSMSLMQRVQKVRKSGLTFAPEAGSQRLRDVINKNVTEEDLLQSCRVAFEGGWSGVKLYFMMGLPTETDADVLAIAELANRVLHTWRQYATNKNRGVKITVSTSCFVPKPHTPFQWEAQDTIAEFERKQHLLRDAINSKSITYNWHDARTSYIEAVLSRGDRRLGLVLEQVVDDGGGLDAWGEYFSFDRWMAAFEKCGVDPAFYATRERAEDEVLPWSMVDVGVAPAYLLRERHVSRTEQITPDCRKQCMGCGANRMLKGGALRCLSTDCAFPKPAGLNSSPI